jgi:hypothetical protein
MQTAVVYLAEAPTYRLDGDMVVVQSTSGDEVFVKVMSINQFMVAHAAGKRIIDEWAAYQHRANVAVLRSVEQSA